MNRKELEKILKILKRIKHPDSYILEAIHTVNRDLERYNNRRGQLRDEYESDYFKGWG